MREKLLDDSEGMYLQKPRSMPDCVYSGNSIPSNRHGVTLRQTITASHSEREYTSIAWVSVGAVDELATVISRFEPTDYDQDDGKVKITPSGRVKYGRLKGNNQTCLITGELMDKGEYGFSFHNPSGNGDTLWLRPESVPRFIDGLESVWEYADNLIVEQF